MNGKIAPKSIVVGGADPISQGGRQHLAPRDGEWQQGASGVRTVGMLKGLTGTREVRQVQAALVGSDELPTRGRPDDLAEVRLAYSEVGRAGYMGKRPAETESFEGNMSVMQWTRGPSMQRGEPPVMETGLERIAAKARCEPKVRFTSLAHHVSSGPNLGEPLWNVLEDGAGRGWANSGGSAGGVQGVGRSPCTAGDIRHLPSGGAHPQTREA